MKANIQQLQTQLYAIKSIYEAEIVNPLGNTGNLIRSSILINKLHEFIKSELVAHGLNPNYLFPHLGHTSPEIAIDGYFKPKMQDILVRKNGNSLISINVRSQLSSIQKNYDTLFERLVAESTNIHERYPELICGYLYLLPTIGYDSDDIKTNVVRRTEHFDWEKYLSSFSLLADRSSPADKSYKYERICLLSVDFSTNPVTILNSSNDFVANNLVSPMFASQFNYAPLSVDYLIERICNIFQQRKGFPISNL